jgi:hypothetical protein
MSTRFRIRSYQRFPYQCPIYYSNDECQGTGLVWNLSINGWRVDGSLAVKPGTIITLCLFPPDGTQTVLVDQATVRWSRGQEFGIETNVMRAEHERRLKQLVQSLI